MTLLKKTGIGLGIILLLLILAVIFVPKNFHAEVTDTIDAKPTTVFNIINNLTLEPSWNPWQQQDTSMVLSYGDVTSGVGASYSWKSNEMGDGSAEYIEVVQDKKIVSKLNFGGMGGGNATYTLTPNASGGTDVKWELDSETSRPWNLMNLLIKESTKKSFRQGLKNLSKLAADREQKGLYRGYQVKEELITERTYITSRDIVPFAKMQQFYSSSLGPLFQKIQKAGVEMHGHPSGLVYNYDMAAGTADMAAGVPISQDVAIQGASSESLTTRRGVVIDYYGDFAGTEPAHGAIDEYLADRGLSFDWPVVEEYVTDPSEESNPEKWLTRIIYYIAE